MNESRQPRAWVGVVSQAHVERGVAGGFAQLCHGKQSPLARMGVGDWLVYYSPRTAFPSGAPLRAFTALGRVVGDRTYTVDMGGGFVPHRRDIAHVRGLRAVSIGEAGDLGFVTRHAHWGCSRHAATSRSRSPTLARSPPPSAPIRALSSRAASPIRSPI